MAGAEVVRLGPPSGPGGTAVPGSGLDLGPGKVGGAIPVRALWSRGQVELRPVSSGDGACGYGMLVPPASDRGTPGRTVGGKARWSRWP